MALSDGELWRLAKRLVDIYGAAAEAEAARRADEFHAVGDMENAKVWNLILAMAGELLRTERENDEKEH
jgi:hypothetical protein